MSSAVSSVSEKERERTKRFNLPRVAVSFIVKSVVSSKVKALESLVLLTAGDRRLGGKDTQRSSSRIADHFVLT